MAMKTDNTLAPMTLQAKANQLGLFSGQRQAKCVKIKTGYCVCHRICYGNNSVHLPIENLKQGDALIHVGCLANARTKKRLVSIYKCHQNVTISTKTSFRSK